MRVSATIRITIHKKQHEGQASELTKSRKVCARTWLGWIPLEMEILQISKLVNIFLTYWISVG